jgi:virginiamycin B lyase
MFTVRGSISLTLAAAFFGAAGCGDASDTADAGVAEMFSNGPATLELSEWDVPWGAETRPRDPAVGPDGKVWFVGQQGNYAGYFDPETSGFERFELGEGVGPHNLIVDDDGIVWFTGNRVGYIGRLDPATKEIQIYPMPDPAALDPHTLIFGQQPGVMFFTVQNGNFVGRFNRDTGEITLTPGPEGAPRGGGRGGASGPTSSRPYGIVQADDGTVWVALFGTNHLGRLNPLTMELTTIPLPRSETRPRRLETTSDGRVWYVDYSGGYLGMYDPESEEVEEWLMPSGEGSQPYAIVVDDMDRIWTVEGGVQPAMFVGFDTETKTFLTSDPLRGAPTVRHMFYDRADHTVWFGTDGGTIGKAVLPG